MIRQTGAIGALILSCAMATTAQAQAVTDVVVMRRSIAPPRPRPTPTPTPTPSPTPKPSTPTPTPTVTPTPTPAPALATCGPLVANAFDTIVNGNTLVATNVSNYATAQSVCNSFARTQGPGVCAYNGSSLNLYYTVRTNGAIGPSATGHGAVVCNKP